MGDTHSTPQSRLRSARKYVTAAEHRLKKARHSAAALAATETRLARVQTEIRRLQPRDGVSQAGHSRSEIERALRLYLADGDALSSDAQPLEAQDIEGRHRDDEAGESDPPKPSWSLHVSSRPRSRNVFGERMSWPHRGRKNRGPLPRGAGPQPARMVRRADLQHVMRMISVRSAEVAFLRGILDWEFTEIAAHYGYSPQAARKAYGKALGDIQTALNMDTETTDSAELRAVEEDLQRVRAERGYWLRRAMRLEAQLTRRRKNLPVLEADAQAEHALLEPAAA